MKNKKENLGCRIEMTERKYQMLYKVYAYLDAQKLLVQ